MPQDPDEIRAARDADDRWFKERFLPYAIPAAILFVMLVAGWLVLGVAKGTLFVVVLVGLLAGGFFGYRYLRERAARQAAAQPSPSITPGMTSPAAASHVPTPLNWAPPAKPQVEQASSVSGRRLLRGLVVGVALFAVTLAALFLIGWMNDKNRRQPTPQELEAQRQEQLKKDEQILVDKQAEERERVEAPRRVEAVVLSRFIKKNAAWPPPEQDRLFLGMALATYHDTDEATDILGSVLAVDEVNQGHHLLENLTKDTDKYKDAIMYLTVTKKLDGRLLRHCEQAMNDVVSYRKKLSDGEKKSEAQATTAK